MSDIVIQCPLVNKINTLQRKVPTAMSVRGENQFSTTAGVTQSQVIAYNTREVFITKGYIGKNEGTKDC